MGRVMSYLLTGVLTLSIRIIAIIFKRRKDIVVAEWDSGSLLYYTMRLMNWYLVLYSLYSLYSMYVYFTVNQLIIVLCTFLPGLYFIFFKSNPILNWFDKKQVNRRVKSFKICPHCKKSHVFSRRVLGTQGDYFYLLNQDDTLVALGDYFNLDHPALAFVEGGENQFPNLVSSLYPLLQISREDNVYFNGQAYELSSEFYCISCEKKINSVPLQHGMVVEYTEN